MTERLIVAVLEFCSGLGGSWLNSTLNHSSLFLQLRLYKELKKEASAFLSLISLLEFQGHLTLKGAKRISSRMKKGTLLSPDS
jgi:hypothetical protein